MPTIPTFSLRNLAVSRGDFFMDTTGGGLSTTEGVIGTVAPFFGNIADRVRLFASVTGLVQVTATTKGSQGGVVAEFRLRRDNVSGLIIDTKTLAVSYSAASPVISAPVMLMALEVPALAGATKTYVVTGKYVAGTNVTPRAEWDELKFQALVVSA